MPIRLLRRILYVLRQRRVDEELAEEIESHRAMRQQDFEAGGLTPAAAADASRRALGNATLAREDARATWIAPWLESVWQDVVYAARMLGRAPAFGASIVLVLAIGIGATTGVFGLLDSLVLRDLPVQRPDRLVYLGPPSFSHLTLREVRARGAHVFTNVAGWDIDAVTVEWAVELEPAEILFATGNFYETLGIGAVAGRTFGPEDDAIGGGVHGPVAVISDACWQRRFARDPSAIGRVIRIDRLPFTIIGVTPPGFSGVAPGLAPEITIPWAVLQDAGTLASHSSSSVHLLGRLRDGLTVADANAAVQTFWPALLDATTPTNMPADRRAMYLGRTMTVESARAGFSRVRNQFGEALWMLLGLVGLLLAVACGSAANLLLARGVARRREVAVRLAIGAGRGRIVRQLLTETIVWTALAAAIGIFVASWSGALLVAIMTTRESPIALDVTPNWRTFAFALGLAFVSSAACAIVPALRSARVEPGPSLRTGRSEGTGLLRRWSLGKTLVAAQVALTIVLLVGASLFVRSLARVLSQDAGFVRDRMLVVATDAEAADYGGERLLAFYSRLLERLRALPGVEAASLSWYPPISDQDGMWSQAIEVDGVAQAPEASRTVYFNAISPRYFETVGMRIVRGRDFDDRDTASAPRVVVVNESVARRFFPGVDPIGRRITIGRNATRRNLEIVAVVSDAKYQRLQEAPRSIAYLPYVQLGEMAAGRNLFAEVRPAGSISALAQTLRQEVRRLDARVPLRVETVEDRIRESLARERVTAFIATGLGAAALALACAGLYGLLAYAVSRQAYELGLRLALGATRPSVLWLVLRECLRLAALGTVVGLAAALALGRYARSLLFEISPTDVVAIAASVAIMLAVAALAGYLPARRAARTDVIAALRSE
jgi:predicted permease